MAQMATFAYGISLSENSIEAINELDYKDMENIEKEINERNIFDVFKTPYEYDDTMYFMVEICNDDDLGELDDVVNYCQAAKSKYQRIKEFILKHDKIPDIVKEEISNGTPTFFIFSEHT